MGAFGIIIDDIDAFAKFYGMLLKFKLKLSPPRLSGFSMPGESVLLLINGSRLAYVIDESLP